MNKLYWIPLFLTSTIIVLLLMLIFNNAPMSISYILKYFMTYIWEAVIINIALHIAGYFMYSRYDINIVKKGKHIEQG